AFGERVPLDATAIAGKAPGYALDLPAEIAAKYRGRPALLATALLSAEMVDLTKPLPPAATADEEALDAVMKRISPAFTAVRLAIDASNADSARQGAVVLNQAFAEVDAFWTRQARADAVSWAQTARLQAEAIERRAAAGEWEAAKTSVGTLGQQCQACHAAYRDQFADGAFRLKKTRR